MKFFYMIQKSTVTIWLLLFMILASINIIGVAGAPRQQDEILISGTVTDATSNEPLPGVSIMVKGTSAGTVTDLNGKYSIHILPGASLQFSFIGYLTEEYTITNATELPVMLVPDIIGLEEIVVVGYGIQKKSDITGSIASVSGDELNRIPVAGVDQALQGLAAGVNILSVSGRPGEEAVIQIRGISSINEIEPLIIIDGVPGSLEDVVPSEIESIEVLKDASSQAIYGDSGGNGVIIITTKKGKAGKIETNFNMYMGIERPVGRLDLMNSEQFMSTVEETYASDTARTSRPDTLANYDWQDIVFEPALTQNYDLIITGGNEASTYLFSASYNNQTGIIRSSDYKRITLRINSEHKLSERITLDEKISFINRITNGLPPDLWNQYYDGPIRKALTMQPDVPDYNEDGSWGNSIYGGDSPLAMLDMIDRVEKSNDLRGNFGLTFDIIKDLSFTSRFAGNLGFWDNNEYQEAYENTVVDRRTEQEVKTIAEIGREFSYTAQQLLNYKILIAGSHNVALMAGMEANREWGYDYSGERLMAAKTPDFLQYFSQSINDTAYNQIIEGSAHEIRSLAYFGRINYDYNGKYLLTANIRRSGRSSFGPDFRFGIFPSFSVGWKFSEEGFMLNQNIISFGKLRFGYGEVGTYARTGTPYLSIVQFYDTFGYPYDNSVATPGAGPIQIANPEIRWETIHMSNIGVDLAFLQNRISLTAEYYNKVNEDMLMLQEVPYISGSYTPNESGEGDTSPEVNIGSIRNSGLEFTLGYKDQKGGLKYKFDLNMSTLKNEVLDLASDSLTRGGVHILAPITLTRIGGSVSEFYGYLTDGMFTREDCAVDANGNYIFDRRGNYIVVNQPFMVRENGDTLYAQSWAQPGDVRYVDVNGDGRILADDRVSLGSPLPKLIFGFSFGLEYRGIDLSAQFNGTIGNKVFNGTKQYLYYSQGYPNHAAEFADRYVDHDLIKFDPVTGEEVVVVNENINTDVPRNNPNNYNKPSDWYVEDGSYLRLRNVTLGYTLPASITKAINVERLRIYLGGRNLITLTKYSGINPEVGETSGIDGGESTDGLLRMGIDATIYPVTRMIFWGVNLTF